MDNGCQDRQDVMHFVSVDKNVHCEKKRNCSYRLIETRQRICEPANDICRYSVSTSSLHNQATSSNTCPPTCNQILASIVTTSAQQDFHATLKTPQGATCISFQSSWNYKRWQCLRVTTSYSWYHPFSICTCNSTYFLFHTKQTYYGLLHNAAATN